MNIEKIERIKQIVRVEATTTDISDFLITHVPFRNLYIDSDLKKSISEDELLNDHLLKSTDEHKFILVQGNNGSGKSHLIRWLKEIYVKKTDASEEKVLLISRAHNTLQDALEQLLESDIFPKEVRESEIEMIKKTRSNISGDELKKTINFNFTLEIDNDIGKKDVSFLDERHRKWLKAFILNEYIVNTLLMKKNGPLERIRAKIENSTGNAVSLGDDPVFIPDDFRMSFEQIKTNLSSSNHHADKDVINLATDFADGKSREECASYLNTKVARVIQRSLKLQSKDFHSLFASLRKILKSRGMRLTIFVEDINSFTGIDEALMEVLLTDHKANPDQCRLNSVIGSTTGFYDERLNESIKERIWLNVRIMERSILGSKDDLALFAAKYINAIKLDKNEIIEWYLSGATEDYPVFNPENNWAIVPINGKNHSLFPFNDNALWNLFCCLPSHRRTPRAFLTDIVTRLLISWYMDESKFLLDKEKFEELGHQIPNWQSGSGEKINQQIDPSSAMQRQILICLWGNATFEFDGKILGGLPLEVYKDFKVYVNTDNLDLLDTTDLKQGSSSDDPKTNQNLIDLKSTQKIKVLEQDINNWYYSKKKLVNHSEYRDILINFLQSSINWAAEEVQRILVDSYISKSRIFIEDQTSEISDGFVLTRNDQSFRLLLSLVYWKYLGNNSWSFSGSEHELTEAFSWLDNSKDSIISSVKSPHVENINWQMGKNYVVSTFIAIQLSRGIDIKKRIEDIYFDLFSSDFVYNSTDIFSLETRIFLEEIKTNWSDFSMSSKRFFSKSIGSAKEGSTKYTFIDAFEVLRYLKELKEINWEVESLDENNFYSGTSTWYLSCTLIKQFLHTKIMLLEKQKNLLGEYRVFFSSVFGVEFTKQSIIDSMNSVKDFLNHLSNDLHSGYRYNDFRNILNDSSGVEIYRCLSTLNSLENECNYLNLISSLIQNKLEDIPNYKNEIVNFNNLLNNKNKMFLDGIDVNIIKNVEVGKKEIIALIEEMYSYKVTLGGGGL